MLRVDHIVSVSLDPLNDRNDSMWDEIDPDKRIDRSNYVRIMAAVPGLGPVCVLTCPGLEVRQVLAELMANLADLQQKHANEPQPVFLWGPRRTWPQIREGYWYLTSDVPDPDWPAL